LIKDGTTRALVGAARDPDGAMPDPLWLTLGGGLAENIVAVRERRRR